MRISGNRIVGLHLKICMNKVGSIYFTNRDSRAPRWKYLLLSSYKKCSLINNTLHWRISRRSPPERVRNKFWESFTNFAAICSAKGCLPRDDTVFQHYDSTMSITIMTNFLPNHMLYNAESTHLYSLHIFWPNETRWISLQISFNELAAVDMLQSDCFN